MRDERFLLDTNVLSEPILRRPNPRVLRRLEAHQEGCATAAPVIHELWFGALRLAPSTRRTQIEGYLRAVVEAVYPVLPYDREAAAWHAAERARLEALGKRPPFADGVIAAIAGARGLTLVTANVRDFAAFEGLRVVSWAAD
ncbi:MAG: type II toxin-antitoxin system VapC family toxin [Myxococcales bacterium]|nr:type II toxin-antitoxin system VapC family toxin [Myxococcales bacterium]